MRSSWMSSNVAMKTRQCRGCVPGPGEGFAGGCVEGLRERLRGGRRSAGRGGGRPKAGRRGAPAAQWRPEAWRRGARPAVSGTMRGFMRPASAGPAMGPARPTKSLSADCQWQKSQPKMQHHHCVDASDVFADPVGAGLRAMLMPQENVVALLKVDLSAALRFAAAWVVLSTDRLLTCDAGSPHWRSWPLNAALTLRLQDHGGVGTLELHDTQKRLAQARFTLARHAHALRLGAS